MKRYFVETNAYNAVLFVDENDKAYEADYGYLDFETAKAADYSNLDGCETAEECDIAIGASKGVFDFDIDDFESVTEF